MKFPIGAEVTWLHIARGGYGYLIRVPARVVGHTARKVIIAAKLADGSEKRVAVSESRLVAKE